jgi:hypothetical protein
MNVCSLVSSRALPRTTRAGEPGGTGRAAVRSALVSAALLLAVGLLVAATRPAAAASLATGDPRSVSQPSIPASCTVLSASLTASNRQFSSAAESSPPDTSRIQSALNDTLSGTDSSGITSTSDNGMRIKSYSSVGGLVSTVTYEGICMTGVKYLLDLDPFYSSGNGSHIPDYTNIVVDGAKAVSSASGAKSVLEGYSTSDPLGLTLENVSFDATATTAENANIGTYNTNLKPSGTNVTVSAISGSGSVPSCSFPSFPDL